MNCFIGRLENAKTTTLVISFAIISMWHMTIQCEARELDNKLTLATSVTKESVSQAALIWEAQFSTELGRDVELNVGSRLRLDPEQKIYRDELISTIDEFTVNGEWQGLSWTLGKQSKNWTTMDGFVAFNLISPRDFHQFILKDFEESAVSQWMLGVSGTVGGNGL